MTLPALHSGVHVATSLNAFWSDFGFGRNRNWRPRFFCRPAWRKVLNPSNEVGTFLLGEGAPLRHVRAVHTASNGVKKVLVDRQGSGWSGAALEHTKLEISGLGINPGEILAVPVTQFSMTSHTITAIVRLCIHGMTGDIGDVR